jgi:ferritin-like metal-binding protein YciE
MGLFTKDIKTKDDLFVHTLQDIYYAEQQITKALPKMIDKASSPELKQAFQSHLRETEGQIKRAEEVFKLHGQSPKGTKCEAIQGIINEAESVIGEVADAEVRDAAMLAAAQAVEHYEISRYGTLATWAREMGREDCARLLHQTLDEEKATDAKLTRIAEARINKKAA